MSPHENLADFFVDLLHWDLPEQAKARLLSADGEPEGGDEVTPREEEEEVAGSLTG